MPCKSLLLCNTVSCLCIYVLQIITWFSMILGKFICIATYEWHQTILKICHAEATYSYMYPKIHPMYMYVEYLYMYMPYVHVCMHRLWTSVKTFSLRMLKDVVIEVPKSIKTRLKCSMHAIVPCLPACMLHFDLVSMLLGTSIPISFNILVIMFLHLFH